MKVVIFGASSPTAKSFIQLLIKKQVKNIICVHREKKGDLTPNCTSYVLPTIDKTSVVELLKKEQPQFIVNFTGRFTNDFSTDFFANVMVTQLICEGLLETKSNSRLMVMGSAAEYGAVEAPVAKLVQETTPLVPVSIYGVTKVYQTQLCEFYSRTHGLDIVNARTFNLLGQGFSERLFVGKMEQQIEKYKKGDIQRIQSGSLEDVRDYIDVSEAVEDYWLIMNYGKSGEVYNVCSGKPIKMRELLKHLLQKEGLGLETVNEDNSQRSRVPFIVGDRSKVESLKQSLQIG